MYNDIYKFISCIIKGITVKLLFTQNPRIKGEGKQVTCLNIKTKNVIQYKSIADCAKQLGLSDSSSLIKNNIKTGKLYRDKYKISYRLK
jgi:hypothetical protein